MATWITHTMIVDNLLARNLDLDKKGFCIGNIAPDCNVENEDWTEFIPPREVTHWMNGKSKLTADYEGFYSQYIIDKSFASKEHYSFLLGYYSHLITDVQFQKFIRYKQRVKDSFKRINANNDMSKKIEGYPQDFDTLKKVFGSRNIFKDIEILENYYIRLNPESTYNSTLRKTKDFKDYLDFLPKGAIPRKIKIMAYEPRYIENIEDIEFYFFSREEFDTFVKETSDIIFDILQANFYMPLLPLTKSP